MFVSAKLVNGSTDCDETLLVVHTSGKVYEKKRPSVYRKKGKLQRICMFVSTKLENGSTDCNEAFVCCCENSREGLKKIGQVCVGIKVTLQRMPGTDSLFEKNINSS